MGRHVLEKKITNRHSGVSSLQFVVHIYKDVEYKGSEYTLVFHDKHRIFMYVNVGLRNSQKSLVVLKQKQNEDKIIQQNIPEYEEYGKYDDLFITSSDQM